MVVLVGITLAVLAAHDVPLAGHLRTVERDRIVTTLERDAFTLAGRLEEVLEDGGPLGDPALQALADRYRAIEGARVTATDRTGHAVLISDEDAAAGADYSTRPEIADAVAGRATTGERYSRTLGLNLLYVAVPVRSGENIVGAVRLTYPSRLVDSRVDDRVRGLLVVALISVATAVIAAVLLAGTVTRPIQHLRTATDRLANGDLAARAPATDGPAEIRSLATSFNLMAARLSDVLTAQAAFAGDASHQLRTPLTSLRVRLEQATDIVEADPSTARQRLEDATAETERLQRLVDQLLTLARAEGRVSAPVPVDLATIAAERVDVWSPLAAENDVELTTRTPGSPVPVWSVAEAVEQIIDNLVDNALAFAPPGTSVEVTVTPGGPESTVHVRDRGPGMTDAQLARAFDRFWRAGQATHDGSGLGLAIVAQLARASGAHVHLAPRSGGGLVASVTFRSAPTPR